MGLPGLRPEEFQANRQASLPSVTSARRNHGGQHRWAVLMGRRPGPGASCYAQTCVWTSARVSLRHLLTRASGWWPVLQPRRANPGGSARPPLPWSLEEVGCKSPPGPPVSLASLAGSNSPSQRFGKEAPPVRRAKGDGGRENSGPYSFVLPF